MAEALVLRRGGGVLLGLREKQSLDLGAAELAPRDLGGGSVRHRRRQGKRLSAGVVQRAQRGAQRVRGDLIALLHGGLESAGDLGADGVEQGIVAHNEAALSVGVWT